LLFGEVGFEPGFRLSMLQVSETISIFVTTNFGLDCSELSGDVALEFGGLPASGSAEA
jgi:hypothetical protein